MTTIQKIIKYGAIAFGIYLSLMIIGGIIFVITTIFGIGIGMERFENGNNDTVMLTKWEQEYANITNMEIDISVCKLNIKKGETLKVEASDVSDQFKCEAKGNKLEIKDKKLKGNFWGINNTTPELTIYIPESLSLEEAKIETGVNDTNIEWLKADKVKLEIGVGKCRIGELLAKKASIKAGAGETNIDQAQIEDLQLEGGVGKLVLTSKILEKADIHCGVGKVELNLIGLPSDYKVRAQTGLGALKVNNQKVADNQVIGNGDSIIEVEAGIGETEIDFKEE